MAHKSKRRRRETKRVRLGKALRAELAPLMEAHRFRNAPEHWHPSTSPTSADCWARRRGPYTDIVEIHWWRRGVPRFALYARCDQPGRNNPHLGFVYVYTDRLGRYLGGIWFGGWLRFIRPSVRRGASRMIDLIHYLDTGEKGRYVR